MIYPPRPTTLAERWAPETTRHLCKVVTRERFFQSGPQVTLASETRYSA